MLTLLAVSCGIFDAASHFECHKCASGGLKQVLPRRRPYGRVSTKVIAT